MDDFEVFRAPGKPSRIEPTVTLQTKGPISLNQAAYELLGSPEAVELLYSRSQHVIGMRPAEAGSPYAIPVRPQSRGGKTWMVAGQAFRSRYGLAEKGARRFVPRLEGTMLRIDLNGPWKDVAANRPKAGNN